MSCCVLFVKSRFHRFTKSPTAMLPRRLPISCMATCKVDVGHDNSWGFVPTRAWLIQQVLYFLNCKVWISAMLWTFLIVWVWEWHRMTKAVKCNHFRMCGRSCFSWSDMRIKLLSLHETNLLFLQNESKHLWNTQQCMTMPHFLALRSNPLRAARSGQVDEMESWCVRLTLTGKQQSEGMQKDAKDWEKADML